MATPFTETEINSAIESLIALEPTFSENAEQYTALLKQYAHLSHKQWNVTENCSNELAKLIGDVDATLFQTLFKRANIDHPEYGVLIITRYHQVRSR